MTEPEIASLADCQSAEEVKDYILWLVQRYGYARRQGTHQGHRSAYWYSRLETTLEIAADLGLLSVRMDLKPSTVRQAERAKGEPCPS